MPRRKRGTRDGLDPSKGRKRRVSLLDQSALDQQVADFNDKRVRPSYGFHPIPKYRPVRS